MNEGASLVVRAATADDAAVLARLHRTSFADAWDHATMLALLTMTGVFGCLAERAGRGIGFALLRVIADEGEILTLAVAPPWRRRGIGRRLLAAGLAEAGARGARRLLLEVAADNEAGLALYRSHGFTAVGRRPRYYGETDAQLLARELER